jgi:hypothetical protein
MFGRQAGFGYSDPTGDVLVARQLGGAFWAPDDVCLDGCRFLIVVAGVKRVHPQQQAGGRVIHDQVGCPTTSECMASAICRSPDRIRDLMVPSGTSNSSATWR